MHDRDDVIHNRDDVIHKRDDVIHDVMHDRDDVIHNRDGVCVYTLTYEWQISKHLVLPVNMHSVHTF